MFTLIQLAAINRFRGKESKTRARAAEVRPTCASHRRNCASCPSDGSIIEYFNYGTNTLITESQGRPSVSARRRCLHSRTVTRTGGRARICGRADGVSDVDFANYSADLVEFSPSEPEFAPNKTDDAFGVIYLRKITGD